jgi:hypothetical protein
MASTLTSFPSLYIPRVFVNIGTKRITDVFNRIGFGKVSKVDFIRRSGNKGKDYNSVYVHFDYMNNTPAVNHFLERLVKGSARVVYDDPWYWLVLENKVESKSQTQPKMELSEENFKPVAAVENPAFYDQEMQWVHVDYVTALEARTTTLMRENMMLKNHAYDCSCDDELLVAALEAHYMDQADDC